LPDVCEPGTPNYKNRQWHEDEIGRVAKALERHIQNFKRMCKREPSLF